jgi:hypothetical protein
VVGDKGRHEEVRVIVAFVTAKRQLLPGFRSGGFKQIRLQLVLQELIA